MPNSVWPGILLSHWGRLDAEPASNTAYPPDNYTQPWTDEWQPADWRHSYLHPAQHPCFDPQKVRRHLTESLRSEVRGKCSPSSAASADWPTTACIQTPAVPALLIAYILRCRLLRGGLWHEKCALGRLLAAGSSHTLCAQAAGLQALATAGRATTGAYNPAVFQGRRRQVQVICCAG